MSDHATFVDNLITTANKIVAAWLNGVNNYVWRGSRPTFATSTGAANTYLLTIPGTSLFTSAGLAAGDTFSFKAHQDNTGAATFSVAGNTTTVAAAIQAGAQALSGGEIQDGGIYSVTWDGAAWQLTNMLQSPIAVALGGTGAVTAAAARTALGAQENVITTKGDLIVGSTAGTAARKAVGASGRPLIANSTQSDGVEYAEGFPRKNPIINGCFRVNQVAPATNADDTYYHDQWYVLTQTAAIAVSTLSDVEDGLQKMARLTQSQAAAQRMAYAQIIEGKDCKHLRGKQVTFRFGRVRCSASQPLRYAILEWTGTEDTVTSDVVNDWTSTDYTDGAGKFFVDANITPAGNTSHTPAAATLTDGPSLTVTLGSTFNNLIVLAWTEGTAAQNVTLDLGKAQLEVGSVATEFERVPAAQNVILCQRFFEKSYGIDVAPGTVTDVGSAIMEITISANNFTQAAAPLRFNTQKRVTPTMVGYSNGTGTAGQFRVNGVDVAASFLNPATGGVSFRWSFGGSSAFTAVAHWTADARL